MTLNTRFNNFISIIGKPKSGKDFIKNLLLNFNNPSENSLEI